MERIILRGGRIVDARGLQSERSDVLIEGDRISAIEPGGLPADAPGLAGARDIDLSGLTLVPGLMNAHSHITLDASPDPMTVLENETRSQTTLRSAARLVDIVQRGVTTIRDLGDADHIDIELREMVEDGEIVGPRMLTAGRIICMTGGHGRDIGVEVDGPDAVRAAVRAEIKAGATCIKLMATGGMMTPNQRAGAPQFTVEEMTAGCEEAHKADKTVGAHAESDEGARNATLAGIDSVDHGHGVGEETMRLMLDRGTMLVPTVLTDKVIVEGGVEAGIPAFIVEKCRGLAESLVRTVELALKMELPIAAGNDGGAPLVLSGEMAEELELLEDIGMHPRDALATATTNTAKLFRLPDVGLVEPGYAADLMAVEGDPLAGARALRTPLWVIARGSIVRSPAG